MGLPTRGCGAVAEGGLVTMWVAAGRIQQHGNVWLVPNPLRCSLRQPEGCKWRVDSEYQCLLELSPERVVDAVDQAPSVV